MNVEEKIAAECPTSHCTGCQHEGICPHERCGCRCARCSYREAWIAGYVVASEADASPSCVHEWAPLPLTGEGIHNERFGVECERCGVTISDETLFACGFVFASNRLTSSEERAAALADLCGVYRRELYDARQALGAMLTMSRKRRLDALKDAPEPIGSLVTWWIEVGSKAMDRSGGNK